MNDKITEAWLHAKGEEQAGLHREAGQLRDTVFGRKAFVRAVIEVSSYCRENCNYCGMRRDNKSLSRYRLELDLLRRIALEELPDSVTDLNIQTGEDPVAVREIVLPLLQEVSQKTSLGISVCLGTLNQKLYDELYQAGARYYIIKMESGNAEHYGQINAPGHFDERIEAIRMLADSGWNVSSGFIMGLPGQDSAHILETLDLLLNRLPLAGGSVSPFIPGENTPFSEHHSASLETTLNAVAIMRLTRPDWVIPAVSAMNLVGENGYVRAIRAGANLTTINLTPDEWRGNYQLYKKARYIMKEEKVLRAIEEAGCEASSTSLCDFLANRQPADVG